MTRRAMFWFMAALSAAIVAAATVHATGAETVAPSCEDEPIAAQFAERKCGTAHDGRVSMFSTRSQEHAQHLGAVANRTFETSALLFSKAATQIERAGLIAWPAGQSPQLASEPGRLGSESLYLIAGDHSNDVRSAISDIVVDQAASPHPDQIPLWLRIALRHWVRGGEQSATLQSARKIATHPYFAYDH